MSARIPAPLGFVIIFVFLTRFSSAVEKDIFTEELYIDSMNDGHVHSHFQFTTIWNTSISDDNKFIHYRLFPKALGDVLSKYQVQELHLSQTQGLWQYEKWGYPPEDAPSGVELWVWFQPSAKGIDQIWAELVNALSGLFCASLNFMDNKATVVPRWSFRPAGLASKYYSFDSRFMRYSAQPGEIVCTENLTPWSKLLPCETQVGLASLFNAMKLYDSSYHSLGIHVRPVCQGPGCTAKAIELKQTLSVVFDPTIASRGSQTWNLKSLFGRTLHDSCPLAEESKIYVDTTLHQSPEYNITLSPPADEMLTFTRGGYQRTFAVYDLKKHTAGQKNFNLNGGYSSRVKYGHITFPPVYANRYITGFGLEKGGISCTIHNTLDTNLTVIYMETIPWFLRVYYNSIKIESNEIPIKPYKTHYIPGKDRAKPYQLELVFRLKPKSTTTVSFEFDRAFLKWTEYPPDANHGFYINSAVISTVLPVGDQYTSPPQDGSRFISSINDKSDKFFLRLHTESLIVYLPTPDFSMPYNVICLACTVVAIAFGSLHNLTTRRFIAQDPDKMKKNIIQKIKDVIFRRTKSKTDEKSELQAENEPDRKDIDDDEENTDTDNAEKT